MDMIRAGLSRAISGLMLDNAASENLQTQPERRRKREITMILVGETGVGKTTFMSLLANIILERSLEQFTDVKDITNESQKAKNQSQTLHAILYPIVGPDGFTLRILDTPGLCDTRGIEWDEEHKKSIVEAIQRQVETIDAVIIMANGTIPRVGPSVEYALSMLTTMFPQTIASCVGFVFTNVESVLSFNFQNDTLPVVLRDARQWTLQNPLAVYTKLKQEVASGTRGQHMLDKFHKQAQRNYDDTVEMLDDFFDWMNNCKTQGSHEIVTMYNKAVGIDLAFSGVLAQIQRLEIKRRHLNKLVADLKTNEQIKEINKSFQNIIRQPIVVQKTTEQHNTLCAKMGCHSNCHIECGVDFSVNPKTLYQQCRAFKSSPGVRLDLCSKCHHSWKDHRHYHTKWTEETHVQRVVDEAAKKQYTAASQKAMTLNSLKEDIESSLKDNQGNLERLQDELGRLCAEFDQLALSGSFALHISNSIRLLETQVQGLEKSGGSEDTIRQLHSTIDTLKKKEEVLEEATERPNPRDGDGPNKPARAA